MSGRVSFAHVMRLSDGRGIFEHANGSVPRIEGGYCLDDTARALIVLCREPAPSRDLRKLASTYFDFVLDAQAPNGACHNRLDTLGRWQDVPGVGDWWGRAQWALGTAAAHSDDSWIRATAATRFDRGAKQRSPDRRAMAFAALGAAEMLSVHAGHEPARTLLVDAAARIGRPAQDPTWRWPEPRLAYANGAIAEALIAAGHHLDDRSILDDGLSLLGWLLETETYDGHLSVSPVGGRGPADLRPSFDQQPIEVAAIADACVRALDLTEDTNWAAGLDLAVRWFLGANDRGLPMWDPATGAGFDALTADGRNANQGAESTLAMIATMQQAVHLPATAR
jgi:hypothetical protein